MKKAIYFIRILSILVGILLMAIGVNFADSDMLLKPPGLRLISEPTTVIPATYHYVNQKRELPRYRNASGTLLKGWSRQFIKTRRFSSDQSAWVYYRQSDLKRTKVIKTAGLPDTMRIWPVGTILILEGYKGDASHPADSDLLEIEIMTKLDSGGLANAEKFFPVDWSYTRYTPDGTWSLSGEKLNECHQCHSIAFRLTGDLVFTPFR
ncbi:MAG: cytochrome P460 family protein [Desulfobacterales bacterium]